VYDQVENRIGQLVHVAAQQSAPARLRQNGGRSQCACDAERDQCIRIGIRVPSRTPRRFGAVTKRRKPLASSAVEVLARCGDNFRMIYGAKIRRVFARELHVRTTEGAITCYGIGTGVIGTGFQRSDATLYSIRGQCHQERAPVSEVAARRTVRHAEISSQSAQADGIDTVFCNDFGRALEQCFAKISVVIGHCARCAPRPSWSPKMLPTTTLLKDAM
jgi:hypothetical protein